MAQNETDNSGDPNLVNDRASSRLRRPAGAMADEACQLLKELGNAIETRPYTSAMTGIAAALGIGLIFGALFERNR